MELRAELEEMERAKNQQEQLEQNTRNQQGQLIDENRRLLGHADELYEELEELYRATSLKDQELEQKDATIRNYCAMISDLVKENDYLRSDPQEPQGYQGLGITRLNCANINKPKHASYMTTPTSRSECEDDHLAWSKSSAGTYTPKTDGVNNFLDTPKADGVSNFLEGEGY